MTTAKTRLHTPFPYPPERRPEDMASGKHLALTGNAHYLAEHLGHPETTIVTGERYIASSRSRKWAAECSACATPICWSRSTRIRRPLTAATPT